VQVEIFFGTHKAFLNSSTVANLPPSTFLLHQPQPPSTTTSIYHNLVPAPLEERLFDFILNSCRSPSTNLYNINMASTPVTSTAAPAQYVPLWPEPNVPFFNKIGAYTRAVIEPSDSACSDCKRNVYRIQVLKGQVAKVLHGKEIPQEYEAICEHALQKKFDSAVKTTKPSNLCRYCTISFYEYRQAHFIEKITRFCYVGNGKRGQERNTYVPPFDKLDEQHPVNWSAPAIPTTDDSNVPTPLEHLQDVQDIKSVIVPVAPEQCNVEVSEEVVIVQQPLEHSEVAPQNHGLGLWLSFILLLGFLIAFSGALSHILQAAPILPPAALDTTQCEWDYVYVTPIPEELLLPTPAFSTKGTQSTATSTSTPTGTFTQPADPTPSPEASRSTYDTIVATASFAVGTPQKVAALVAGVSFVLGALHFGPSIIASFTE
jgi:hypothetical protein